MRAGLHHAARAPDRDGALGPDDGQEGQPHHSRALLALPGRRRDLEDVLRPLGFFRAKAQAVIGIGQALVERYGGQVPKKLDDLVTLPGVGRKTANVVLGNAFGVPGLTVDTHFGRLVRRLEWTSEEDPVKVEAEVGELIEKREWTMLSHRLIFHGRRVCFSRKPACGACTISHLCPSFGIGETDPVVAATLVKTD